MFVVILALLIIWPIAELFVMVQVAQWIGFFWMLFAIFASTVSGILILKHRGRAHWRRFRGAVDERRPPAREAFDGVMITAGALLLIIPGFITSALGLLLLFPPTRWLVRLVALTVFASKFKVAATTATWGNRGYGYYRSSRETSYDIDGEAVDVTDRPDGEPLPQLRSGSDTGEDQNDRNT
ncbi:MAG: FxsA family protein [Solirubrobacterales bacterium]|nr:FxsA family protein [Solirubrobacterales bacterium]